MVDNDNDRTPDEEGSEQGRGFAARVSDLAGGSRRGQILRVVGLLSALLIASLFVLHRISGGASPCSVRGYRVYEAQRLVRLNTTSARSDQGARLADGLDRSTV
jgi:hypothetical protein